MAINFKQFCRLLRIEAKLISNYSSIAGIPARLQPMKKYHAFLQAFGNRRSLYLPAYLFYAIVSSDRWYHLYCLLRRFYFCLPIRLPPRIEKRISDWGGLPIRQPDDASFCAGFHDNPDHQPQRNATRESLKILPPSRIFRGYSRRYPVLSVRPLKIRL